MVLIDSKYLVQSIVFLVIRLILKKLLIIREQIYYYVFIHKREFLGGELLE